MLRVRGVGRFESDTLHASNTTNERNEHTMVSLWKTDIRAIAACVIADMENEGIEITPETFQTIEFALRETALFEIR